MTMGTDLIVICQWRAINCIGKITAMDLVAARPKCRPVELILEAAVWEGTRLSISILNLDRRQLVRSLKMSDEEWSALALADFDWPTPQWWMWHEHHDVENRPGWWDDPEPSLVHLHGTLSSNDLLANVSQIGFVAASPRR